MKKVILLMLCAIVSQTIISQNFDGVYGTRQFASDLFQVDEYIKRQNKGINFDDTESYVGTPYNNPNYLAGNIYKDNELWATNIAIRYNAVADEMEIKESLSAPDEDARVLTKSPDVFVKIMNQIFIFAPYKGGIEGGGYFEVLVEGGKMDLYKKWKKDYNEPKPASTSLTKDIPASFKDKPVFYLVDKKGVFYELPSSRNKKLKALASYDSRAKNFVKENQLNLNEEEDLIRALKFINK